MLEVPEKPAAEEKPNKKETKKAKKPKIPRKGDKGAAASEPEAKKSKSAKENTLEAHERAMTEYTKVQFEVFLNCFRKEAEA